MYVLIFIHIFFTEIDSTPDTNVPITHPLGEPFDSEESEILEESVELGSNFRYSLTDGDSSKKYESGLPSSVPESENTKQTLKSDPQTQQRNLIMPSAIGTASDEWMKARRLIKVASLFQRRLHKGQRSLSDPEIEIPNEFALEHLERERYMYNN